jgi:hypothetical protein
MEPIYIPHLLQAKPQQRVIAFETQFPDLPTLMPVRGQISVQHCHTYLADTRSRRRLSSPSPAIAVCNNTTIAWP